MKRSLVICSNIWLAFVTFLVLSFASLFAQTNFVKYAGNPILPLGSPGQWDDTEAAFADVQFDGTSYHMWYSGAPQESAYRIGYATSADGINWTKDASNPVLNVGGAGTFDSIALWTPNVYFDESGYQMWYSGGLTISGIGYATAPDPTSWSRQSSNPVIVKGSSGAWDDNYAYLPVVMQNDTLYKMWYSGQSASGIVQTGYATSTDGINWIKYANNPVLPAGAPGEWDFGGASAGSVLFADGQYHMWYFNWSNPITQIKIGYATSPDGINWTKHPDNPVIQPGPGNWDAKNVWFPAVIKDGHRYRMWYTGTAPGRTIDRLGYAEDFSNAAHTDSIVAFPGDVVAGAESVYFEAFVANPHNEILAVRALVQSVDGTISQSIALTSDGRGRWGGSWAVPDAPHEYTVGIELNNLSAGYVHNSRDWGVSDDFQSIVLTHAFQQTASTNEGGSAGGVAVRKDRTVFLANGEDGLRAYAYDGSSFASIAHVNDGGEASGVAIDDDGRILLANGSDGLRLYTYNGAGFANVLHINNGGEARSVATSPSGIIFLANGADGLRAYIHDVTSITNTAHINDGGAATRVAVGPDGTVFLANGGDGLRAYKYNGTSFTNTAHADDGGPNGGDVAVSGDGTVFYANSFGNLWAYRYDGASLTKVAHAESRDWVHGLAIAADSTIFLAGRGSVVSPGDLHAFRFDGTSLIKTANLNAGLNAADVTVGVDGTIFVANSNRGLAAFTYTLNSTTGLSGATTPLPSQFELLQNYPNPFNPATTIAFSLPRAGFVTLKVYNLLGKEVASLVEADTPAGRHTVSFDASALASGLYYYTLTAGAFTQSRKMLLLR